MSDIKLGDFLEDIQISEKERKKQQKIKEKILKLSEKLNRRPKRRTPFKEKVFLFKRLMKSSFKLFFVSALDYLTSLYYRLRYRDAIDRIEKLAFKNSKQSYEYDSGFVKYSNIYGRPNADYFEGTVPEPKPLSDKEFVEMMEIKKED